MARSSSENSFSLGNFLGFVSENFVLIVLMVGFFLAGFFVGSLWTENKVLRGGSGGSAPTAQAPTGAAPAAAPGERDLSIPALVAKAVEVTDVSESDIEECIASGQMADAVQEEFTGGQAGGVTGTPGTVVFVDGQPAELIGGALPYAQVQAIIEKYLDGGEIDPTLQADVANAPSVTAEDNYRGASDARIVLVEYSDYECPFCERFHPTAQQALDEYPDDVAWVFRHYPLSFHPNAQKAAEAAECVYSLAGNDAFWAYTDRLFTAD